MNEMHRSQLIWGVILLLLGGLMLANSMGIRLPGGLTPTELFWPLILILAGLGVMLGIFARRQTEVEQASLDLQGASEASVQLSHGAGELKLHSGAGMTELAHGSFAGGLDQKTHRSGSRLEVRMQPKTDMWVFPFFGPRYRLDWELAFNADIPLALTVQAGANKSIIDLHDLRVIDFKLETGASDTRLTLPAHGRLRADLDLGAASLEVIFPAGVAGRVRISSGVSDVKVDEARFPRAGGVYQSPDFDSAPNAVDLTIDAGVAQIKVR